MRAFFEGMKLHPAVFVASAVAVTAVAVCLSMYTIGATARYDGVELGTVRSAHSVSAAVDQLEEITRQTLSDTDYSIDSAKLEIRTGIVARKELESTDALEENLTRQLGLWIMPMCCMWRGSRWRPRSTRALWRSCWSS